MSDQRTPEEIRAEIEETREDLADTAAALAYKADVKSRAQERVEGVKSRAQDRVGGVKGTVRERVGSLKSTVSEKTPESAGEAMTTAQTTVRENPVHSAAIGAAVCGFGLGFLLARRRG